MKALNIFIKRIAQHPILSCSEYFKIFITAKQGVSDISLYISFHLFVYFILQLFDLYRRQKTTTQRKLRTLSNGLKVEQNAIEFDQIKSYLILLHSSLNRIERITSKIHKERSNAVNDFASLHTVFTTWAPSEPDLSGVLRYIGKAIQISTNAENNLALGSSSIVSQPIKELLLYIDAVQEALRKRESCQKAYEYTVAELNRRQSERHKVNFSIIYYFTCLNYYRYLQRK